jgi:hypothetical protein
MEKHQGILKIEPDSPYELLCVNTETNTSKVLIGLGKFTLLEDCRYMAVKTWALYGFKSHIKIIPMQTGYVVQRKGKNHVSGKG